MRRSNWWQVPCVVFKAVTVGFGGVSVIFDGVSGRGKLSYISEIQVDAFAIEAHFGGEGSVGVGDGDGEDVVKNTIDPAHYQSCDMKASEECPFYFIFKFVLNYP